MCLEVEGGWYCEESLPACRFDRDWGKSKGVNMVMSSKGIAGA